MELKEQSVKSASGVAQMLILLLVCYGNLPAFCFQVGVI